MRCPWQLVFQLNVGLLDVIIMLFVCIHTASQLGHALLINALLSHTLAGISHLNLVGGIFTDHCVVGLEGRSNGVRQMGSIL